MASAQEYYEKGLSYYQEGSYEQAYIAFSAAAKLGHAEAQVLVGKHCLTQAGKREAMAFTWFQEAVEREPDNAGANYQLSRCYELGCGTAKNGFAALHYLSRAAELGDADAQTRLGERYLDGDGVEKDAEEALEWLEKAITQEPEHIAANYALGRYYDHCASTKGDEDYGYQLEAYEHYARAAEQGHIEAQYCAGSSAVCYPPEVRLEWLKKVVAQDPCHAQAWAELADLYAAEEFAGNFSGAVAFEYYMTAAKLGYPYAQYKISLYYLNGWGVKRSPETWAEWLRRAAKGGHMRACWDLGQAYECGLHGLEADGTLALKYYKKGYERGMKRCGDRIKMLCEKLGIEPPPTVKDDSGYHVPFEEGLGMDLMGLEEPEEPAQARLEALVGLDDVKQKITSFIMMQEFNAKKVKPLGRKPVPFSMHMVFTGNPGTGKTTVARLIGEIFHERGILSTGAYVEVKREDLVAEYIGQTAPKTKEKIENARGGVLFIDEAYSLSQGGERDFGQEAIDTILTCMEEYRDDLVVIAAGYEKEMQRFIDSNSGLQSRFKNFIHFPDYDSQQLCQIFHKAADDFEFRVEESATPLLSQYFEQVYKTRGDNFGNARDVRNFYETVYRYTAKRLNDLENLTLDDFVMTRDDIQAAIDEVGGIKGKPDSEPGKKSGGEKVPAMERLSAMVGLGNVKDEIRTLRNLAVYRQLREKCGKPMSEPPTMHMVFTGNPGTGKTTVAKMIGEIYHELGLLSKGHVVEVKRKDLVGEFIGQTAPKTQKIIKQAMGGVLFIDEAYTLNQGGEKDFGPEAVTTLLAEMEERRDSMAVIVAGYENEMQGFINMNPGLRARFTKHIRFEDYTGKDLAQIFRNFAEKDSYTFGEGAEEELSRICEEMYCGRGKDFGNAREARNLFDDVVKCLADRMGSRKDCSEEELLRITKEDILKAEEERKRARDQEPAFEGPGKMLKIGFKVDD